MLTELPRVWLRVDFEWHDSGWTSRIASSHHPTPDADIGRRPAGLQPMTVAQIEASDVPLDLIESKLDGLDEEIQRLSHEGWLPTVGGFVQREGGVVPVTIPLFVRVFGGAVGVRYDLAVAEALSDRWRERVTVITERPQPRTPPPRMTLPLRAMIYGDRPDAILDYLRDNTHWFRESLELVEVDVVSSADRAALVSSTDITVIDRSELLLTLGAHATRLIVSFDGGMPLGVLSPTVGNYLSIGSLDRVAQFLQSLTHDLPLHDALTEIVGPRPEPDVMLVSSPDALHELRLTDLVTEYAYLRSEMESGVPIPFERTTVTARGLTNVTGHRFEMSETPVGDMWSHEMSDAVGMESLSFDRESNGLLPLWERLLNARAAASAQRAGPDGEPRTFDRAAAGEVADKRVVDITLRRHPSIRGVDAHPLVRMGTTLAAGGRYDARVRIGQRSSHSIIVGAVPPIRALLPTQEHGHYLDVICFEGDFTLESEPRIPLYLPPLAPTPHTAEFHLRAPLEEGRVSARIGVYHRNNLIQSFLLTATVAATELREGEIVGPTAELDHHTTRDWENLDALGPRHVSLLVNSNGQSHRLYALGNTGPAEWRLPANVQEKLAQPVRDTLEDAINVPPRKQLFDLASAGHELYLALYNHLGQQPAGRDLLRTLRTEADRVLQIVRADVHQSLPWGLVYDWPIPHNAENAQECMGTAEGGGTCAHTTKDSDVICLRGFWGIRHLIEELVGARETPPLEIRLENSRIGIDVSAWTENDYIERLMADAMDHADVNRIASTDSLFKRMWNPSRAPVCAVIGHYENEAIQTGTSEGAIRWTDITEYSLNHGDLADPHPLVMLLTCESGRVTPNDTASHALSLVSAGVAGLVATECSVYTSQVKEFSIALLEAMATLVDADPDQVPFPMANAIRTARTTVAAQEMIAGLAFVCFGPASVRFVTARED